MHSSRYQPGRAVVAAAMPVVWINFLRFIRFNRVMFGWKVNGRFDKIAQLCNGISFKSRSVFGANDWFVPRLHVYLMK